MLLSEPGERKAMKANAVAEMVLDQKSALPTGGEVSSFGASEDGGRKREIDWLKRTLDEIILGQRPRIPGWGVLGPNQSVGDYATRDEYLLLVFDHNGRPHTHRFAADEIARLQTDESVASERFRSLIESFCSPDRRG